ncbi:hypothetical protein Y032_0090g2402 [Ancylostoma ceylanicum]|uniref:Uncharacterized protein n=1 Tax=Ancylostoma ceylanicum TaxID=53326 RepID=A0A016TM97_9BILA|nr:hypothetical protein Y032_0090g2402 [Ancylostoma ceylanicum]
MCSLSILRTAPQLRVEDFGWCCLYGQGPGKRILRAKEMLKELLRSTTISIFRITATLKQQLIHALFRYGTTVRFLVLFYDFEAAFIRVFASELHTSSPVRSFASES